MSGKQTETLITGSADTVSLPIAVLQGNANHNCRVAGAQCIFGNSINAGFVLMP